MTVLVFVCLLVLGCCPFVSRYMYLQANWTRAEGHVAAKGHANSGGDAPYALAIVRYEVAGREMVAELAQSDIAPMRIGTSIRILIHPEKPHVVKQAGLVPNLVAPVLMVTLVSALGAHALTSLR